MPPPKKRDSVFTLRIYPEVLAEFHIACELRGATMSSLVHQYIVQTIRDEKARDPGRFTPKAIAAVLKQMQERAKQKARK